MERVDLGWLVRNPVPEIPAGGDKNERGRVLIVGGAGFVPGASLLAGEAALRAGAGKLRIATTQKAAMALGMAMPEAAILALPADESGEIGPEAAAALAEASERCDAVVIGPGMVDVESSTALLVAMLGQRRNPLTLVLDAACIDAALHLQDIFRANDDRVVITPHYGEMARLTGATHIDVQQDAAARAEKIAHDLGVTVVLKSDHTIIASKDGEMSDYASDCPGLATSGSGDVLAGVIGGLLARGASPHVAGSWGVWLHGEAGRIISDRQGRAGFLARELLPEIPKLADVNSVTNRDQTRALHKRSA